MYTVLFWANSADSRGRDFSYRENVATRQKGLRSHTCPYVVRFLNPIS